MGWNMNGSKCVESEGIAVGSIEVTMSRAMLWAVLYWAWIATEVIVVVTTWTRRRGGKVQDRGSMLILWVVIFASISFGFSAGGVEGWWIFGGAHWVRTLSLVVLVVGLAIRWTAIVTLGRSFSVNVAIHATQTVHKTGLFRWVRHPSYTGLMLVFVAIGLYTRHWIGFAVVVIAPGAALLYRIHVEERALRGAFGEEYVAYSRVTKRLVPGIY
jgi:protein-S-isoprenylcysteine O-methyltransferase Ste14